MQEAWGLLKSLWGKAIAGIRILGKSLAAWTSWRQGDAVAPRVQALAALSPAASKAVGGRILGTDAAAQRPITEHCYRKLLVIYLCRCNVLGRAGAGAYRQ
ncbi:hypothetical protein CT3_10360 [Comamonas terrigena NBRC 13299]|nr:hypothetical protein CT3_10360 [Comamonas terrigena NBRC 13299]